ncbi:MAG: 4-alpha-glucanotransferase [Candidatus Omnitrophota bacterium]|jgi:4-alpha-glucanotransferase
MEKNCVRKLGKTKVLLNMSKERKKGVLAHITMLPSEYGIGDLGNAAYRFIDFLVDSDQSLWQILPINQTDVLTSDSPYSSFSAFAGNILLIDPEQLVADGYLKPEDVEGSCFSSECVDYVKVRRYKESILKKAYEVFKKNKPQDLGDFCKVNNFWLRDYALYCTIKKLQNDKPWNEWDDNLCNRVAESLSKVENKYKESIDQIIFEQYIFYKQWYHLLDYASQKNIEIMGDIPIYVNLDSADVWSHPELFKLDEKLKPTVVAGVPPDYFSDVGQRWGNPIYDWNALRETNFSWWKARVKHNLSLFNIVRIDHFRGLVKYWEIAVDEKTAVNGKWMDVPTDDFFNAINSERNNALIIAEDLGIITPDVTEAMKMYELPGMKVLQFAFNGDTENPYLPHHYEEDCVVYTGTHDNNTTRGWFLNDITEEQKEYIASYTGFSLTEKNITGVMIDLALSSNAKYVIFPIQDLLNLSAIARFNTPGTIEGNWTWRIESMKLVDNCLERVKSLC